MVPMEMLSLEHDIGDDGKHGQRDTLLNDLKLYQREGSAIADKPHTVGWYLTAVLEEGDAPRECNDSEQRPMVADTRLG